MPRQSISRQIEGIMLIEAATSSRKIEGTISRAGMTIEIAVIESSENPKPEKPRTMAAQRITMLEPRSNSQWPANCAARLSQMVAIMRTGPRFPGTASDSGQEVNGLATGG